ncbi:MAG TPA: ABC transporter permease [Geobacterales bacterium]|nr:ABC transporter permease [Geobacterales bacterium]
MMGSLPLPLERTILPLLRSVGAFFILSVQAVSRIFRFPFPYREWIRQVDRIGVGSLFIIVLTGLFTGMIIALLGLNLLRPYAAVGSVGGMVAVTMVKELGPVLAALMVAGRVGAAITAELGTMVVTEQVDAMAVEGTDVIQRLVTTRLLATVLAMPLLTQITNGIALLGGFFMATSYQVNATMYWQSLTLFLNYSHLLEGFIKPLIFGFIIAMVGCHLGLSTQRGAEGVGDAAKRAVVISSVLILMTDFFIAKIFLVVG